jgi:hypothetical protein
MTKRVMTDARMELLAELEAAEQALAKGAALVASLPNGSRQEREALDRLVDLQQTVRQVEKLIGDLL